MDSRIFLVFLAVLATATAVPINFGQRKCSAKCTGSDKFKYTPGTTYSYNYDGTVTTKINGAMEEGSGLHMTAAADIEVMDKCNLVLKLRNVRLEDNKRTALPGSARFGRSLEENALHFSFQDGRIEELCTVDEAKWALNIKRGVLSAFQNSMDDLKTETVKKEIDVAGECDAEYKLGESAWRSFSVVKTKNLMGCTKRQAAKTAFQATPYTSDSGIQSLPLTKGTHKCQHDIHNNGYLLKSDCQEEHIFRPFSKGSNGATTSVSHRLEFMGESTGISSSPLGANHRRTDLLYEHEPEPEKNGRDLTASMDSLKAICEEMKRDVRPTTPHLFSELVYRLKELDARSLSKLYRYVNNNGVCRDNHEVAKKFFMDAIPMVGTTASVSLIGDLVSQRTIQGPDAEMWLSSLAFIQQPTQQMLTAVKILLESVTATKTTYLAGSALVNSYCKDKPSCARDPTVQRIASVLEGKLNYNCRVRGDRDKDRIMMTLKALGNMGNGPRATDAIIRCMMESTNAIEIRLAAIDAMRRQPCDIDRSRVLTVFADANEDAEIRIAAYLATMQCPTPEVVDTVTHVLNNEKVNQVGSFVWTHITNLRESSCPLKQDLRKLLQNKYLQKEFDLDSRKYSRNFEGSFFSEWMNSGANIDGNLVWSQKSFVPRSAMLNLTVDLFGQSVNLLEVGGRVEGMEHMLKTYFGDNGYFPDTSIGKMLKRNKRSAFDDKINRIENEFNSKMNNDLKGSMYFRIFGHELSYFDFAGLSGKSDFNVLELLIKLASNHRINYSKSVMFLDTTVTIPTILGMPLKLSINGTATVNIQIQGKMDIRKAFTSPRSMDITGSIKPSGAVAISSLMSIDAFVARTGLKMVTTLHSSTEIDGSIKIEDGEVFITKINMPHDRMEILNAENKLYLVNTDKEVEQTMPKKPFHGSRWINSHFLTELFGWELIRFVRHPAFDPKDTVFVPLMGPSSISLILKKRDTLTSYDFEARLQNRKHRKNGEMTMTHIFRLAFNTPGSKINREMSVDFLLDRGAHKMNFNLISPWTKVNLNGELTNTEESKQANLRLKLNDKDEYAFLSQLTTMAKDGRTSFSPNIEIRMPKRRPVVVSGLLDYTTGRKVDVNLIMENLFTTPVTLKGGIEKDVRGTKTRYNTNIDVKSHYLDTKVSGYLDSKPSMHKSRMTVDYRMMQGARHRLSLNYKIRNVETVSMRKISVDTAVQTTQWPEYNFELSTDVQKTSRHAETSLSLRYGADDNNPYKRIAAAAIVNYDINGEKVKADGTAKLNFPAKNIDFNMKVNHNHDTRAIETKVSAEFQPGKRVNVEMNLRNLGSRLMKMTGDITLELPSRVLSMSHQIEERQTREYHHNMILQWQRGRQIQTTSMYKVQDKTYTITSNIQLPERPPININAYSTLDPKNFVGSMQVTYERKTYGLDLGYKFNQAVDQLLVEGRFDARHPIRRVTAYGLVKRASDDFNTKVNIKWDADRDETKVVNVEGEYKLEPLYDGRRHSGKFLISYPGREATMTMNVLSAHGKYQSNAEVQWEVGKKIALETSFINGHKSFNAKMKFTSPFRYFETIGAAIVHNRHHSDISTNAEVTWAVQKTIKIETTIKPRSLWNFEVTGSIATPFSGYRMMTVNTQYALGGDSFSGALEGALEGKKVGMTMSGSMRNGVSGNMKMDLPLMSHPISAKFSHRNTGGLYDTSAELAWSLKKISAVLKIKPVSWQDMEFTLGINTPFQKFPTMVIQGIHKLSQDGLQTKVFGQYDSKKIGLEISGKNLVTSSSRSIEGVVHMNSPFQGYEDMSVTLKHSDDGHRFSSAADATWDDKKIGATLYMTNSMRGWTVQSTGRLHVVTPFTGYERNFYNWRHNNDHHGISSSHSLTIRGMRYTLTVGGKNQVTRSGRNLEGKLNIQTPHEMARDLSAEMTFLLAPSSFKTSVLFGKTDAEKIELGLEGSFDSRRKFMGSATLDLSAVLSLVPAPLKATVRGQMNSMPYTGHVEAVWAKEKISLDFSTSPISWRQFEASVNMKTPFSLLNTVGLKATSTINNNDLTTIIISNFNDKKVEMHIRGSNRGNNDMIDLTGSIKLINPFTSDVALGMKFMKQASRLATTISGSYDTYRTEAGFDVQYDLSTGFKTKGNAGLVLPIFGEQKMAYAWDLNTDLKTTFNSQNTYSWNAWSFVANADLVITTDYYGTASKAHVTIETPMDIARVMKIDFDHAKRGNSLTSNLRFSRNRSQTAAFNMEVVMDTIYNVEGTGKLTINRMEPISFSVKSLAAKSPYSGHLELSWGRQQKIGVYGTVANSANAVDTSVTFTSPFEYFKKIAMKVNHKTEGVAVITAATVEYQPGKIITLSTKFDNSNKYTGRIALSTPWKPLQRMSVSYEHDGSAKSFDHMHSIEYQGWDSDIAMTNTMNFHSTQHVTGSMHFTSPFEMFRNMKVNFVHREERSAYTTNVDIELEEGRKIEITSILEKSDSPKYTMTVKSPYEYLRSMNVNFEHNGQFPYTTTTGRFEMQNRYVRVSAVGDVKIQGLDSISASLRLITPIKYYEHMFLSLTHGKVRGEWRSALEGQLDTKRKMSIKTTFSMENKVEGGVTVTIPQVGLEKLHASFEHQGSMTVFTLKPKFEMKWLGERTKLEGELQVNGINDMRLTVDGDTPFAGHQTIALTARHSTSGPVRTFTVTMDTPTGKSEFIKKTTVDPNYKVEVEIRTPYKFLQSLDFIMEHTGRSKADFHNKIGFNYVNLLTRIVMTNELTVNNFDLIDNKFHLTSPIKHLEVVNAAFSNRRQNDKYTTIVDVEYSPRKQILLKSTVDIDAQSLDMSLKTPFQKVQDLVMKIQHQGTDNGAFTNKVLMTLNREQVINSDLWVNGLSAIRGKTEVYDYIFTIGHRATSAMIDTKMTLKDIGELVLSHEVAHGSYNGRVSLDLQPQIDIPLFKSLAASYEHSFTHGTETVAHVAYESPILGKSSADVSLKINGLDMVAGSLHVNSPWIQDIEMIVDHKTLRRGPYQSSINVIAGNKKLGELKSTIDLSNPLDIDIALNTLWDAMKTMTIKINHSGRQTSFANTARITMTSSTDRFSLDSSLTARGLDALTGRMHIRSSVYDDITVRINHSQRGQTKVADAAIELTPTKKIEFSVEYKHQDDISAKATFQTPWEMMKNVAFELDVADDLLNTRMLMRHNKFDEPITFMYELKAEDDMEGKMVFTSGCPVLKRIEMSGKVKIDGDHYLTEGSMTWMDQTMYFTSDVAVHSLNSMSGRVTLKSPIRYLSDVVINFEHHGDMSAFHTKADVNFNNGKIQMEARWKAADKIEGTLELQTPFMDMIKFGVSHNSPSNRKYDTKLSVAYGAKEVSVESLMSVYSLSSFDGSITLRIPCPRVPYIKTSFAHHGSLSNFRNSISIETPSGAVRASSSFHLDDAIDASVKIETPWGPLARIILGVRHTGELSKGQTTVTVQSNHFGEMELTSKWSQSPMEVAISLDLPSYEKMSVAFKYDKVRDTHAVEFGARYGPKAVIYQQKFTVNALNDLSTEMSIKTPWKFSTITFSHTHSGGMKKFTTLTTFETNVYGKMELATEMKASPVQFTVNLKTPWTGIQDVNAKFTHQGDLAAFKTSLNVKAEGEKIAAISADWTMSPIAAKIVFDTAFCNVVKAGFSHDNQKPVYKTNAEFAYGPHKSTVASIVTVRSMNDIELEVSTTTPFEVARESKVSYSHRGNAAAFAATMTVDNNKGYKVHANGEWNMDGNQMNGKLTLRAPFLDPTVVQFKFVPTQLSQKVAFESEASVSVGGKVVGMTTTVDFISISAFDVVIGVRTPLPAFPSLQMTIKHRNNNYQSLNTNIEIDCTNSGKSVMIIQWNAGTVTTAKLVLDTPYFPKVAAEVKHDIRGTRNYKTDVAASYGALAYALNSNTNVYDPKDISINADMKTHLQDFRMEFAHNGDLDEFNTVMKLDREGELLVHATVEKKQRNGNVQITTAFEGYRTLSAVLTKIKHGYTVVFAKERQEIKVTAEKAEIRVETPFTGFERMHAKFDLQGFLTSGPLIASVHVMYMTDKEIALIVRMEEGRELKTTVTLTTPFEGAENTEFVFHIGTKSKLRNDFVTNARLTYMRDQVIAFNMKFLLEPDKVEFTAGLETPFKGAEKSDFVLTHDGTVQNFDTKVKLTYMRDQVIDGNVHFSMGNKIELTASLKTPFDGAEMSKLSFTHDGGLENFNTKAKVTYMRNQVIEANVVFSMGDRIELTATLRTPFTGAEMSEVVVTHEGELTNFNTDAKVTYMRNQVIEGNMRFTMGNKIEFTAMLKTPFMNAEMSQLSLTHEGSSQYFRTHARLVYMSNQVIEGKMQFAMDEKLELTATLETPFTGAEMSELTLTHEGHVKNFNTHAKLTYMRSQTIESNVHFSLGRNLKLTADLKTPFSGAEHSRFSFSQGTNLITFNTIAKLHIKNQEYLFDMYFNRAYMIQLNANLKTPFENMEKTAVAFSYEGWSNRANATVRYMKDQVIEYSMQMKDDAFAATLKTPFSGAEFTQLQIKYRAESIESFSTKLKLTYMKDQVIEYDMKMSSGDKYEFTASLKTPFSGAERSVLTATHKGTITSFHTGVKLNYQTNKVISATTTFSMDDNTAVFAQLRTPFTGFETTELSITHHNGYDSFNTEIKFEYMPYKRIEGRLDYSFSHHNHLEITANLKTPFTNARHSVFILKHKGGLNNFNTNAKLTYSEQEIKAKLNFKNIDLRQLEVSAEVTTPFQGAEKMGAIYTHSGDASQFECTAAVEYNDMKPMTGNLKFRQSDAIEVTAEVTTPFVYAKTMTLKFNHGGSLSRFRQNGEFTIGQNWAWTYKVGFSNEDLRTITLTGELNTTMWWLSKGTMKANYENDRHIRSSLTVFNNYQYHPEYPDTLEADGNTEIFSLSVNHERTQEGFRSNHVVTVYEDKFSIDSVASLSDEISGSLSIEIPRTTFVLTHTGTLEDLKTKATLTYGREEYLTEAEFKLADMRTMLKVTAPTGRIEINHAGFPTQFANKMIAVCAKTGTYQMTTNFNLETAMASMEITSPGMNVEASHKTEDSGFVTKLIAVCKTSGRYLAEANFNKNTMAANLNINTPYGNAAVTHAGRIQNFETRSTVNVYSYGAFNVEAKFNLRDMEGQFTVTTPYGNVKISHSGQIARFTTRANASILSKDYGFELRYNRDAQSWIGKMNTPYYTWTGNWVGPLTNFKYNVVGTDGQGNGKHTMEVSFKMDRKITGSFLYKAPIKYLENIALSFSHHGDFRHFETDASVSWTTTDTIAAHVDFRRSRRNIVGSAKLETPFTERFALTARHQGQLTEFTSSITADYGSKKGQATVQCNQNSALISLKTPFKYFESLSASLKKTGTNGYHAEVSWAPRKKIMADVTYTLDGTYSAAAATGSFMITTPFGLVQSLSIEFEHRHSLFSYLKNIMKIELNAETCWDTKAEIRIAADRVNIQAAMTIPHPTTASVKMFNSEKEKTADIDVEVNGVKVYLNAFHKDESSYYRVKRDSSIKLIVPARTMALTSAYDSSRYQSNHKVEITLDQERGKKVTYEGTFADRSRSYQKHYEGTVKLTTPLRTLKTTVTHIESSNNFNTKTVMMWDADSDQDKKMEVDTVYEKSGKKHIVAVTLKHPRLIKDISLRGEITINKDNFIYAGKTQLQYSSDPSDMLTLSGKVNDESHGRRQNYSMSMQVSHPKSLIDVDMSSHIGNTDSKMSAGMEMKYLTARRSRENFLLRGEIDKLRKSISMKLRTPMKKIAVNGGMTQRRGIINLFMTNTMDSTPYRHTLEINTKMPSFSLKTTFAPGKMYSLAGTANTTTAKIEASRIYGQRITTDGLASVNLNGSKVLYTRLHWAPSLMNDVEEYATETFTKAKTTVTKTVDEILAALTNEWNQHSNVISNSIPDVAAVSSYITEEADSFKSDAERIKNEWDNMYNRNEFFVRNIDEYMTTVINYIQEKVTLLQFQMRRLAAEWGRYYQTKMAMYRRFWDEQMGKLEETIAAIILKFRPAWQSYAYALIRSYQETSQKLRHRFEETMESMNEIKASFVNYMDDKFDFISYKMEPYFAKFGDVQETLRYYLLSEKQKTYLDLAKQRIVSFFENVRDEYKQWKIAATDRTKQLITEAKKQIKYNLGQILGHEYSQLAIDIAQQAVVDMKKAYSDYEIESRLKDLLKGAYYKLDDYARKQVKTLIKNYMRIGESRFTVFEPNQGRIEAKIFLPLEIKSLDQLPDLKFAEIKAEIEKLYAQYKPSSDFCIWDFYYKYKPTSDVMNWIPPFKAHATLAHGKHFTTFDGTTFDFAGTCSYLLARDFGDANFTAIVNYKDGKTESYTIYSNNKKIELFPDFKVMVDDARTEMPFEYKNTTITRDESTITVANTKGFVFTFDTDKEIVNLDISGWYFGRTGGLFGLYDNEPSNDFILPSHKIATDLQEFTLAWEVSPYCRGSRNLARTSATKPGSAVETACKKFFESGKSPLRPCFSVVPVQTYYRRCISDLEQDFSRKAPEQKACKIIDTYVAKCRKAEVHIKAPEMCTTCPTPSGGLMYPGQNVTFNAPDEPNTNSADVIFVVEEKECNRAVAPKLSDLALKVEKSLKLKGMNNNRFAVVGFGGHDVHNNPHPHTMEDQIFNDARKMNLIELDFHTEGSNKDLLSAVSYAANFDFRAGVSKSIVLIPCSSCEERSTSYKQLYNQLKAQDIVLHIMMEHDFRLRTNSPKSNYIFGIDANSAYTNKDVVEQILRGDTALLRQVVVPKDSCVSLAHKTQGSFFSVQKLTTGRYSSQKSFIDVFARRVAMGATVSQCQDCKCTVDENGNGRSICKSCPVDLVKVTPAKQHLLGHMGENPEVGPLATPPVMEFEEAPLDSDQSSVRIVGQRRPISYTSIDQ